MYARTSSHRWYIALYTVHLHVANYKHTQKWKKNTEALNLRGFHVPRMQRKARRARPSCIVNDAQKYGSHGATQRKKLRNSNATQSQGIDASETEAKAGV